MGESVAAALNQVADRLERMAVRNADSESVIEAVADALDEVADRVDELDQSARSRHDRLTALLAEVRADVAKSAKADLRDVLEGVERVEAGLADLTSAGERLGSRMGRDRNADRQTATAMAQLAEASGHQTERLAELQRSGVPAVQRSISALDKRLAEVVRHQDEQSIASRAALDGVTETLARLATAQAEDLEQIMDTIDAKLDRPGDGDRAMVAQLAEVARQLEALRRRIPLRGRAPEMSDATIDALADRLVERMRSVRAQSTRPRRPAPDGASPE
jgi:DNA-binding ferritin-like protein